MYAANVLPRVAAASGSWAPWSLADVLRFWRSRAMTRAELRRLLDTSQHLIDDIGLDSAKVAAEAAKPFWRA